VSAGLPALPFTLAEQDGCAIFLQGDEINLFTLVPPVLNRIEPEGEKSFVVEFAKEIFNHGFKRFSDVLGKLRLDIGLENKYFLSRFPTPQLTR
jgi:hypothetical protein